MARRELHEAFNFRVVLGRDEDIEFASCSPIEVQIGTTEFREGGAVIPIVDPTSVTFPTITLTRGASRSEVCYKWLLDVMDVIDGEGFGMPVPNIYRRTIFLYQYDREKNKALRYDLYGAFPVGFKAGEWDNARDEIVIESLTIRYDFFTRSTAATKAESGLI